MMQQTLSHYFGYETFRPGQEEIISKVLDHRNVLGVLPTGGGKSICYQVPGLLLGGTTIVISPLISLMKDQVDQLKAMGIQAAFLNSSLTQKSNNVLKKHYQMEKFNFCMLHQNDLKTDIFKYASAYKDSFSRV